MTDLRTAAQQALEALEDHAKQYPHMQKGYTVDAIAALRAALAQQAEPVADPFADIRDKRMGELNAEQTDRATELWLREQIGPREDYWYPHLQILFRIIDRLRAQAAPPQRKPLTSDKDRPDQGATYLDGFGYVDTRAVRAVERAHGIGEGA